MSRSINKDRKNDINNRYKMPEWKFRHAGGGNGCFTIIDNLEDVSKSLGHPSSVIIKYISIGFGCNSKENSITGHQNKEDLDKIIDSYIQNFIICPQCQLPELIPYIVGKKKKKSLFVRCSACGYDGKLTNMDKNFIKGEKLIMKHIEKNGWQVVKGSMVEQNNLKKDNFDPFNL